MQPPLHILITALLAASAHASPAPVPVPEQNSNPHNITTFTKPLSELPPTKNTIRDIDIPNNDLDARTLARRAPVVVDSRCIEPQDRPIWDDCAAICEFLLEQESYQQLPPFETIYWNAGGCLLGVANLSCYNVPVFPPQIAAICDALSGLCVADGYDGFALTDGPRLGIALTGEPAAPPYQSPGCPGVAE
ncbi:hypothetical protein FQN50_002042 [Emmonsiellopsis sp. PD_5]|nr:hypothetical protein FQN50_002042 [Emmonsiellopsis sp. PD_5]